MKIAVTDACIFIDIYDLRLTSELFKLPFEIHTSADVFSELYEEQQELLRPYVTAQKMIIHNLVESERYEILNAVYPSSLSMNDKTVLYLADRLNAIILSSDKVVRTTAKRKSIEYHGMLWIFDRLVEGNFLSTNDAIAKLKLLISRNIVYQNNTELVNEMNKRIKLWSKSRS